VKTGDGNSGIDPGEMFDIVGSLRAHDYYIRQHFQELATNLVESARETRKAAALGPLDLGNEVAAFWDETARLFEAVHPEVAGYSEAQWNQVFDKYIRALDFWVIVLTETHPRRHERARRKLLKLRDDPTRAWELRLAILTVPAFTDVLPEESRG
jgi:hypothetical protein